MLNLLRSPPLYRQANSKRNPHEETLLLIYSKKRRQLNCRQCRSFKPPTLGGLASCVFVHGGVRFVVRGQNMF